MSPDGSNKGPVLTVLSSVNFFSKKKALGLFRHMIEIK